MRLSSSISFPLSPVSGGGEETMVGTAQCNEPAAPALMFFFSHLLGVLVVCLVVEMGICGVPWSEI